ncbi:MAG: hypothetical protein KHY89_03315 [Butyricicoccus pullicaecorum]|nr:hypothetical protein [Butyricicoccus pullicaecorum]
MRENDCGKMTDRQKQIAEKQRELYLNNWFKKLSGIEVLEIYDKDKNVELCTMYETYLPTYRIENGSMPYSKLPFSSAKSEIYAWILQNMKIMAQKEYFLYNSVWIKIRVLDADLAVESLWEASGDLGILLAQTDYSCILEVGADSRDEENYLIDIWEYHR